MANTDHIKWLLLGVDSWNAKRQSEQFRPDLEGVNVYAQFDHAGKLNSEGRIPLDGIDLSDANLYRANLTNANLTEAKLWGSDLRYADFSEADLARAQVSGSQLEGTVLHQSRLIEATIWNVNAKKAYLRAADLTSASIVGVDLEGAELTSANLSGCKLAHCNLNNANLTNAVLTRTWISKETTMNNTVLVGSEPTRAILFENPVALNQFEDVEPRISAIAEMIASVSEIKSLYSSWGRGVRFYFRGEPRGDWTLSPQMVRKVQLPNVKGPFTTGNPIEDFDPYALHDYAHHLMDLERGFNFQGSDDAPRSQEGEMLLDLMSRRPHDFANTPSALAQWGLAQHHGLKTRLLDVTRNMLVAMYFACEKYPRHDGRIHVFVVPTTLIKPYNSDTVSIIANFAKLDSHSQWVLLGNRSRPSDTNRAPMDDHRIAMRKLYHLIREEKPHFAERIDPRDLFRILVVEPQKTSERIQAQSGAFMVSAYHERFERSEIQRVSCNTPVYAHYQITVPAGDCKTGIMEDLQVMGITRETLYPGLDSSARVVNDLYRQLQL